jgi:hypothetical protein
MRDCLEKELKIQSMESPTLPLWGRGDFWFYGIRHIIELPFHALSC